MIKLGCKYFKDNLCLFNLTNVSYFMTKNIFRYFILKTVSHWGLRRVKLLHSCQRQFLGVRWYITHCLSCISKLSIRYRLIRVSSQKWAKENSVKEKKPEIMSWKESNVNNLYRCVDLIFVEGKNFVSRTHKQRTKGVLVKMKSFVKSSLLQAPRKEIFHLHRQWNYL